MGKGSSCIKVRARIDQQMDQRQHSLSWPSSTKLPGEKRRGWVFRTSSSSSLVFSRLDSRLLLSSSFPNLREATPRSLESPSLVHAVLALVSSTVIPSESPSFSRPRPTTRPLFRLATKKKNKDPRFDCDISKLPSDRTTDRRNIPALQSTSTKYHLRQLRACRTRKPPGHPLPSSQSNNISRNTTAPRR